MNEAGLSLDAAIAWVRTRAPEAADRLRAGVVELLEAIRIVLAGYGVAVSETEAALIAGAAVSAAAGLLVLFARPVFRRRRRRKVQDVRTLSALTRGPCRLGLAAALLFVAVFGGWSAFAPLASAALAPGVVSPDGNRKTIQHLEGGIIQEIHVREGDRVSAGAPLITLDDTRARAMRAEIYQRLMYLLATEARLQAERADTGEISFPDQLLESENPLFVTVMDGQQQLLASRRATHLGRTLILEARIRQLDEQNAGLQEVVAAQDQQIALITEEIEAAQELLEKGLERKPRVLALRRELADISASKASNRARIAENAQAVGETELQLLAISEERQERINDELAEVTRLVAELRSQLPARDDILARTVIRAPIDGTVMNVRATTETGVIGPGEPLLEIVPDAAKLIIDARVRPTDIERITSGMEARVVLTAYKQRSLPLIHGTLRSISADALVEERTGEGYFLAKVEVSADQLGEIGDIELVPGMPAEVMLMDGERSLVGYLLAPILDSARRSLRDG